jgi:hypothetical protein
MKITKDIITREQALAIAPSYVAFMESGDFDLYEEVRRNFETAKKGAAAITMVRLDDKMVFVKGKISSVNHDDFRAVDGPVVRFANSEATWRVDGSGNAYII